MTRPARIAKTPTQHDGRDPAAISKCIAFAESLGIKARIARRQWQNEFLSGILVWRGALFINPERILGYDDILHELGHLAILPSVIRKHATGNVSSSTWGPAERYCRAHPFRVGYEEDPVQRALIQAGEAEAMAWGFAAMTELGLPLRLSMVDGADVLCQLGTNSYLGINGLQAAGMTTTRTFPKMLRWVQP